MPKTVVDKFSFSELEKIEKVKLFTQSFICIDVFNVRGCLASCLSFRPFLALEPLQIGCL